MQTSLTGHLVLATLHANDGEHQARLADMGVEPYLLASEPAGVLAQRWCARSAPRAAHGDGRDKRGGAVTDLSRCRVDPLSTPTGCAQCNATGYRGRTGI